MLSGSTVLESAWYAWIEDVVVVVDVEIFWREGGVSVSCGKALGARCVSCSSAV